MVKNIPKKTQEMLSYTTLSIDSKDLEFSPFFKIHLEFEFGDF